VNLRRRLKLIQVGAFLVPLVVVAILTAGPLPGPARVNAAPVSAGAAHRGTVDPRVDAARRWLDQLPHEEVSPFATVAPVAPAPEHSVEQAPPSVDGFRLGGVFASSKDAVATINGRLYRIGDEVTPGATLESIDARQRKATIRFAGGRTIILTTDNHGKGEAR
jgi:hypothetical protein